MLRVGVLVSGGGTNLQAIIDAVEAGRVANTTIVSVVTNRKAAFALERAKKHGIETAVIRPKDFENKALFTDALIQHFDSLGIELIVLAGYLVILEDAFIAHFRNRIINVHPSLIPAFCGDGFYGLKVHEKALERGVKLSGATVHFVDEITDGGPIISQKTVEVLEDDTPKTLQKRVMEEAEWQLLPEAIHMIATGMIDVRDGKVLIEKGSL